MGRSDRRTPSEWNLDTWADDIVRLCDALDIEHPYVLGASFGGMVAMRYLARHPHHPAKVVLLCTSARVDVDQQVVVARARGLDEESLDAAERFWRTPTAETGAAYLPKSDKFYVVSAATPPGRAVQNYEIMFHFLPEKASMGLLPGLDAVTCPVLVMGGALDPISPAKGHRAIASVIGETATLDVLDGASHIVWADHPDCIPRLEHLKSARRRAARRRRRDSVLGWRMKPERSGSPAAS